MLSKRVYTKAKTPILKINPNRRFNKSVIKSPRQHVKNNYWVEFVKNEYWDMHNLPTCRTAKNLEEFHHINHTKHAIYGGSDHYLSISMGGLFFLTWLGGNYIGYKFIISNIKAETGQTRLFDVPDSIIEAT